MSLRQKNIDALMSTRIDEVMDLDEAVYFWEEGIVTLGDAIEHLKNRIVSSRVSVEKLVLPDRLISWLRDHEVENLGDLVDGGERLVRRFYYGMTRIMDGGDLAVRAVNKALEPYGLVLK